MSGSNRRNHELFRRYPLSHERQISMGKVPTPYHIYNGSIMFIGGTADFHAVSGLLANEQVQPLKTIDGKALMAIWICDFTEASLDPHIELQFSFFVSSRPLPPVPSHDLAILKLIALNPAVKMLCHGLWNNTEKVVAYNRELLGLNARLMTASIQLDNGLRRFSMLDSASDSMILEGHLRDIRRQEIRAALDMTRLFGLSGMLQIARQPCLTLSVVNPIGLLPHNGAAQTFTKNDSQALAYFDPNLDNLTFGEQRYHQIGFTPNFINYAYGCNFVYLEPESMKD